MKHFLQKENINHQNLSEHTLVTATEELLAAFSVIGTEHYHIDRFGAYNMEIYKYEENIFSKQEVYRALSLACISFIDLGLIELS